ncbi:LysR family transcriptional regulator [Ensifer soli]|uniref:LysR family transcriptional regulator n=1 Tax=Ciceribacter sp. sgz301302 TaxID=3342379 RepID=UPI0035B6EE22
MDRELPKSIDPALILSLVTVAEKRSFTLAAERLGLRQSTVSQHVRRLETLLGRPLLRRDTHSVATTPDGDVVLELGRDLLKAQARILQHAEGAALQGSLRVGASEDLAFSLLPRVLARFAHAHPAVSLELTVGLSGPLYDAFDAGRLDVIFVKRRGGDRRGEVAWSEDLAWIAAPGTAPDPATPLPLVLYPPPSITRTAALSALEKAGRRWHVACTCASLNALRAAAIAGLGVVPHSARLIPEGLVVVAPVEGLPPLGRIEFVVIGPGRHDRLASALADTFLEASKGEISSP